MTNSERILKVLAGQAHGAGICDDCLEIRADVHPRQQVNQICHRLQAKGLIVRRNGDCAAEHHEMSKELNILTDRTEEESPPRSPERDIPGIEKQTDAFSQWLFDAGKFLDQVENISRSKDPFAARVSRLKHEGLLPSSLSNRMQTLNNFRVQVVKERKALDCTEWDLAAKYIGECRACWKELTKK